MRARAPDALPAHVAQETPRETAARYGGRGREVGQRFQHEGALVHGRPVAAASSALPREGGVRASATSETFCRGSAVLRLSVDRGKCKNCARSQRREESRSGILLRE